MAPCRAAALALGLFLGAMSAEAQEAPAAGTSTDVRQLDVDRLPVNLSRLQRELRQSSERRDHEGLNLRFQVDVFGRAPQIQLFTREDNLTTGPVPYGAPTHQQMLEMMTPKEFSSPAMDFNALFRWLSDRAK